MQLTSTKEERRPELVKEELSVVKLKSFERLCPSQARRSPIEALDVQVRSVAHSHVQDWPDDGKGPARGFPSGSLKRLVPHRVGTVFRGTRDKTRGDSQGQGQTDGQDRVAWNINEQRSYDVEKKISAFNLLHDSHVGLRRVGSASTHEET